MVYSIGYLVQSEHGLPRLKIRSEAMREKEEFQSAGAALGKEVDGNVDKQFVRELHGTITSDSSLIIALLVES